MTCRIERVGIERGVVLRVSGRITGGDVEILRTALEETCVVAIDLAEIDLVDRDAVMFLVAGAVAPEEVTRKSSSALHQPVIAV